MKSFQIVIFIIIIFLILSCTSKAKQPSFIKVKGMHFELDGKSYYFLGTNVWFGCNLGSKGVEGDRDRLIRELDHLKAIGINNLRVLGASEGNTQTNTVNPPIQPEPGIYDETLLDGLDFLLAEMEKRDMFAVIFLNNYWVWSGGMAQYVSWYENEEIPNPFYEQYSWDDFMKFSARFYGHDKANLAYKEYIKTLIFRKNNYTGELYKDDPTIMSWQLANEPRPGKVEWSKQNFHIFKKWVEEIAGYIKFLDPNHLVSIGSEGLWGCMESEELYLDIHRYQSIDYLTVHLWLLNWKWFDPQNARATYGEAVNKALEYLQVHIKYAQQINKPLVFEEFGIPRDNHSYSPEASTIYRDKYLDTVFNFIYDNSKSGGPLVGSNFWAWSGEGMPRDPLQSVWKKGDPFTGDPPQEPQGRNAVFSSDTSTIRIISAYAHKMNSLSD